MQTSERRQNPQSKLGNKCQIPAGKISCIVRSSNDRKPTLIFIVCRKLSFDSQNFLQRNAARFGYEHRLGRLIICGPAGDFASCSIKFAAVLSFQYTIYRLSKSYCQTSVHSCRGGCWTQGAKHVILSEPACFCFFSNRRRSMLGGE